MYISLGTQRVRISWLTACLTHPPCGPSQIHTTASHSLLPASAAHSAAAVHTRAPGSDRPLLAANTTSATWPTRARCQVRFYVMVVCSVPARRCGSEHSALLFLTASRILLAHKAAMRRQLAASYSRKQPSCAACDRSARATCRQKATANPSRTSHVEQSNCYISIVLAFGPQPSWRLLSPSMLSAGRPACVLMGVQCRQSVHAQDVAPVMCGKVCTWLVISQSISSDEQSSLSFWQP